MTALDTITLARGSHPDQDGCDNPERCLFEAYNWLTRHVHTDSRPPGVSPVLHTFGMSLNDILPDDRRQGRSRGRSQGRSQGQARTHRRPPSGVRHRLVRRAHHRRMARPRRSDSR